MHKIASQTRVVASQTRVVAGLPTEPPPLEATGGLLSGLRTGSGSPWSVSFRGEQRKPYTIEA
jgi:hypothetical protein